VLFQEGHFHQSLQASTGATGSQIGTIFCIQGSDKADSTMSRLWNLEVQLPRYAIPGLTKAASAKNYKLLVWLVESAFASIDLTRQIQQCRDFDAQLSRFAITGVRQYLPNVRKTKSMWNTAASTKTSGSVTLPIAPTDDAIKKSITNKNNENDDENDTRESNNYHPAYGKADNDRNNNHMTYTI
jgi:hypothetical protein